MRKYWVIVYKKSSETTDAKIEKEIIPKCLDNNYVCM